jgi:hypothetical protein
MCEAALCEYLYGSGSATLLTVIVINPCRELKSMCESALCENITTDNVLGKTFV